MRFLLHSNGISNRLKTMSLYLVSFSQSIEDSTKINPAFLNWEKSFVSGPDSVLYEVEHRISNLNPQLLFTRVKFKQKAEGPPGHVHGGATAALIDEVMGILVWHHSYPCVTEKLSLQYLQAVPLNEEAIILTEIVTENASSAKKIEVRSTVYNEMKKPFVLATGLFHRLNDLQLEQFRKHLPKTQ